MLKFAKSYLDKTWRTAMDLNKRNILDLLREQAHKASTCESQELRFLDLGCDDGNWTVQCAQALNTSAITGVDIVEHRLKETAKKGIETVQADLNAPIPISDASQDIVHANQVIEHVADVDHFASEIWRLLKPGGGAVISTENASSWCNVAACAMGWQMFSLTNVSAIKGGIGNPFAIHRNEPQELKSWTHKTIFSYLGLREFFEAYGFRVEAVLGAGYFPLPAKLGSIDVRHSHFITVLIRKPQVSGHFSNGLE